MLTEAQRTIVKATVPLLETGGEALTQHFYALMLREHPEVRPLFNQAHQASGAQPRALAQAVLNYAKHIDRLERLGDLPAQIVHKHVPCRSSRSITRSWAAVCCRPSARSWARTSPPTP